MAGAIVGGASLALWIGLAPVAATAGEDGQNGIAAFELSGLECGELNDEGALAPLRAAHTAGEDADLLCKVKVTAPAKGAVKVHTLNFTVQQDNKTSFQQTRDVRLLAAGTRTILFVVPAEKLPTDGGKVRIRAELSRPAGKPGFREVGYELNAED